MSFASICIRAPDGRFPGQLDRYLTYELRAFVTEVLDIPPKSWLALVGIFSLEMALSRGRFGPVTKWLTGAWEFM
jgi:hypothetical protein